MGLWLEIVTLLVPGFNDSDDELKRLSEFLVSVSPDIPWHVTAFHKDYKMTDPENTTAKDLIRAAEIGKKAGLRYVYAGNLPGQVGALENTRCYKCQELLIERYGYLILSYNLTPNGCCPSCGTTIPGRWGPLFREQITSHPYLPRRRRLSDFSSIYTPIPINRLSVERWLTKLESLRFHPSRPLQISSKLPSTKHERNMMVRSAVFNRFVTPSPTTKVKTGFWPSRILLATLSRLGHRVGRERKRSAGSGSKTRMRMPKAFVISFSEETRLTRRVAFL